VAERVRAFARPTDVLVAWSATTLRLVGALTPWTNTLGLKGAYGNLTRTKPGELADIPRRHDVAIEPIHFSGRAGLRMCNAIAVTRWMATRPA
jgi:hypothetical protein